MSAVLLSAAWVDSGTAAEILCITVKHLSDIRAELQAEGTWSIEWRPNSSRPTVEDARGCGLLLLRADVERVAEIRRRCRCSQRAAIRIYDAIARQGPL